MVQVLFEWAAVGQIGYSLTTLLALFCGCLATAALTGTSDPDAGANKRLLVLAGMAGVYAFGGWKLMEQAPVMELLWYSTVGRPWGALPSAGAELGGPAMWSIAAVSLAVTAAVVIKRRHPDHWHPSTSSPASATPAPVPAHGRMATRKG